MPTSSQPTPARPPVAPARPVTSTHHGIERVDEYDWMRDKDSAEVREHLEAENAWTRSRTEHLADLREQLFGEIKARTRETDLSVPSRNRGYWYYGRSFEGREYGASCRVPVLDPASWTPPRPAEDAAPDQPALPGEEVLLDLDALAEGHEFFSLGGSAISPDDRLLAWAVDTVGDERYTVRVRDLASDEVLPDVILGALGGVTWERGGTSFCYTTTDESWRADKVWRHRLGTAQDDDELLWHEPDERFWVGVGRTRSQRFVMVVTGSKTTSEVHVLDAERPELGLRCFLPRQEGLEYSLEHAVIGGVDRFLVLHNATGPDFELAHAPVEPSGQDDWTPLVPHDDRVRLEEVDAFSGHLVIHQRSAGLTQLRILELREDATGVEEALGEDYLVSFDREIHTVGAGGNPGFDQPVLRLGYTSLAVPASVYDYDVRTRELTLLRRQPVLGDYDEDDYEEHRLWATAPDGVAVPISLVVRKDARSDGGPVPLHLYGYGAYEMSIDPGFSIARLSLLDRGAAFAVAHVRGGGEMGRRWYDDGKLRRQAAHLRRLRRLRPPPRRDRLVDGRARRRRGRLSGRSADRRGGQPGARRLRRAGGRGAVRGHPHLDARRQPPADGHRVRRVGRPLGRRGRLRRHRGLRALRERHRPALPGDPGRDLAPRHPGALRRAGQVGGPAARRRRRGRAAALRDAGRPRRRLGPLPGMARPGVHPRLDPGPDGPGRVLTRPARTSSAVRRPCRGRRLRSF